MKLNEIVLLEIVDIVRDGITQSKDISQSLRNLDLVFCDETQSLLTLSNSYMKKR